jgi:hypothetical protein
MTCHLAQTLRRALIPCLALAGISLSSCGPDGREPTSPEFDAANLAQGSQPPGLAQGPGRPGAAHRSASPSEWNRGYRSRAPG